MNSSKRNWRLGLAFCFFAAMGPMATGQNLGNWEALKASLSNVRGVNFVPDYISPRNSSNQSWYAGVASPHAMWFFFDKNKGSYGETKAQLRSLKGMGVNAVRVWLSAFNYWENPSKFLKKFDDFLQLCSELRIRVMPVIWDSHQHKAPILNDLVGNQGNPWNITNWTPNPGIEMTKSMQTFNNFLIAGLPYVRDIIAVAQKAHNNGVVFCWDIWNEPPVADAALGAAYEAVIEYTGITLQYLDPGRHVTIGMPGWLPDNAVFPRLAKKSWLTVLSGHAYSHFIEGFEAHVRFGAMCLTNQAGWSTAKLTKPFLITECGGPGGGADYSDALNYARKLTLPPNSFSETQGVGFMYWQGMIGIKHTNSSNVVTYQSKHIYSKATGLFYTDGQVRDKKACEAFKKESILQGVDKRFLTASFTQKLPTNSLYYATWPLDVGTNYASWKTWITKRKYDDGSFLKNGKFTKAANDAAFLFNIVTDITFTVHDLGPIGYRAFGLSDQLKVRLWLDQFQVWKNKSLSPTQRLAWLETWRSDLVLADRKASGPR